MDHMTMIVPHLEV